MKIQGNKSFASMDQHTCMSGLFSTLVDKKKISSTSFGSDSGFSIVKKNRDFPEKRVAPTY